MAAAAAAADPAAAADCSREFCSEFCGERKGDVLALRMRCACSWWRWALCSAAGLRAPETMRS